MCFGAKAPNIVYQGPSQEDIDANKASLDAFQQQISDQQGQFQSQLQAQIDQANQDTEDLQARLASEATAAAAASAAQQNTAYATTVQETAMPEGAQTTAARTKKKTGTKTLKIGKSAAPAAAGAGLNISSGGYA
mgnify:CR=1 FL=1|tara:strand:+ start:370 stop:774 length:405 start_codon:yes stop_codon:yes gene_type:complete